MVMILHTINFTHLASIETKKKKYFPLLSSRSIIRFSDICAYFQSFAKFERKYYLKRHPLESLFPFGNWESPTSGTEFSIQMIKVFPFFLIVSHCSCPFMPFYRKWPTADSRVCHFDKSLRMLWLIPNLIILNTNVSPRTKN